MEYVQKRGARIPALGFGTWELTGASCIAAVSNALDIGYRHIDTAQVYGNETEVAAAISASGVLREDLWLTTKVWYENLKRDGVLASMARSLDRLRTDYVDLLLIHWPSDAVPLEETLGAMMELRDNGKIRHIGVSNFPPGLMCRALDVTSIVCNQVEYHPLLNQDRLLQLARSQAIALIAYSPLARGKVVDHFALESIGRRYGKSPAQVALRWLLDHGNVAAIPKAARRDHALANFEIFDFELTPQEQTTISRLGGNTRLLCPPWAPDWER